MVQANVDVGVFQEKNSTDGIYTRGSDGYRVVATPAPSQYRGRVALFYRDYPNFSVEAIRQFGANIIACQLETGEKLWNIVRCYLAPGDGVTIWDVEAVMKKQSRGAELIVVWYLSVYLERMYGQGRDKENCNGCSNDGARGSSGTVHTTPTHTEKRLEDVGDGATGEGGEVPDGLYSGVQSPDLSEYCRTGPEAQLRPLHGHGVPARHLPEGTLTPHFSKDRLTTSTTRISDEDVGGQDLHQVASRRAETGKTGGAPQIVHFIRDVETRQQESL